MCVELELLRDTQKFQLTGSGRVRHYSHLSCRRPLGLWALAVNFFMKKLTVSSTVHYSITPNFKQPVISKQSQTNSFIVISSQTACVACSPFKCHSSSASHRCPLGHEDITLPLATGMLDLRFPTELHLEVPAHRSCLALPCFFGMTVLAPWVDSYCDVPHM